MPGTMKPKILYLVTEDWYFCCHWLALACAARDRGYDVVVCTRVRAAGERIRSHGLRLIDVDFARSGLNAFHDFKTIWRLKRLYQAEKPALVHHVAMKPVLYGTLASLLATRPVVINTLPGLGYLFTAQDKIARGLRLLVSPALRWLLNHKRSCVIVQNDDDKRFLKAAGLVQSAVVIKGAGVDPNRFAPQPEQAGPLQVILPGRMLWAKGVGEFVEAARLLKGEGLKARFILVGDPDEENPSAVPTAVLNEWRASSVVEWWGWQEEMPRIYEQAHIVCLPSYREGLPTVLLEAGAMGRPVIASDVPGCREVVRHGENGLLVPARDAEALVAALRTLLNAPALRKKMGECGRQIVLRDFTVQVIIEETVNLYRQRVQTTDWAWYASRG